MIAAQAGGEIAPPYRLATRYGGCIVKPPYPAARVYWGFKWRDDGADNDDNNQPENQSEEEAKSTARPGIGHSRSLAKRCRGNHAIPPAVLQRASCLFLAEKDVAVETKERHEQQEQDQPDEERSTFAASRA